MKLDQQILNQTPIQQLKAKPNPYFLWEQHNITLIKSQNFGYGIAISGGLNNTTQDSSIYISDIVPGGPAENKLLVDDIILSVNGVNVENVEHSFVIRLLKEAKDFIHLVIKRKINQAPSPEYVQADLKRHNVAIQQTAATVMSNYTNSYHSNGLLHSSSSNSTSSTESQGQNLMSIMMNSTQSISSMKPFKVQLNRKEKKELFGIVLGCKFYIKDILPHSIASHETNLKKGDILLKLNDLTTDQISLFEANKILSKYKDNKLNLLIKRSGQSDDEEMFEQDKIDKKQEEIKNDCLDAQKTEIPESDQTKSRGVKFFSNKNLVLNYRNVIFPRENGIGIRLAGGNKVGIFICDVQYNSPAERAGLKIGDKIIKVNGIDYTTLTREEAVQHILSIQNMVEMIVANSPEEYEPNAFDPLGSDSFYIRTHFNCSSKNSNDLEFKINDILHVTDTLYNGVIGQWVASRLDRRGEGLEETKGTIPNKVNAEQLVQTASTIEQLYTTDEKQNEQSSTFSLGASARMSIRMKLSGRNTLSKRSKSASRAVNETENNVKVSKANTFYSNKFNAYERVVLKEVNFARPIVLFGPLADVAREKLKGEFPNKYEIPECYSTDVENAQSSGVIKLASIKTIIEKGRHCLLDITPNAVDHLNYAQYYPICIYLKAQSRNHTKELRQKYAKNLKTKSSKRLYDNSIKLETYYSHLFTGTIQLESNQWFKKLKDIIDTQQAQPIWITQENELSNKNEIKQQDTTKQNESNMQQQFVTNKPLPIKNDRCVFDDNFEFPIYTTANPTISGAASTYSLYEENDFNRCSFAASDTDLCTPQHQNLQNDSFSQIYSTNFNNKPTFQNDNNSMTRVKSDPNLNQDLYVKAQITYTNAHQANYQAISENQDAENWKKFATFSANTAKHLENGSPVKSVSNTPSKTRPALNETHFSDQFKRLSTNEERNSGCYKLIKNSQSNLMPNTNKSIIDQQMTCDHQENNGLLLKPINKNDQIDHMTKHQLFKQELDNKLKNDLIKCKSTNNSMKINYSNDVATLRRSHKESPSRPPPPVLPKPKFILPQTSTTNLVLQRNLKSKSELNIATPSSNFSSSSAACSSSSSTSSASSQIPNDINMDSEPKLIIPQSIPFQQQQQQLHKPRNKLLENNSLISSSQGYQSDTWESHSSRQSFDLDNQFCAKYSKNLIKPIQEVKKMNNGSTSSDDTENENGHFIKKSILVQKPTSSSSSTVSTSSSSSTSSAVGLTSSATISEESIKKRVSNDAFEIPVYFQPANGTQNDISSMSSSSNSYYFNNQQNNTNQKYSDINSNDSLKSRTPNTYIAHYNDNGIYRKLSLDSNSNCSIIASANGIFDTNGGILESADTGVSLNVPEGAIANGCSFDLYFKVCHCKSTITNGKGEVLTNPIVMCGPRGIRFLKPIELQIPHFISIDGQSWSYAFKTQDNMSEDEDPYNWNATRFHKKTLINSVTVQLDSF